MSFRPSIAKDLSDIRAAAATWKPAPPPKRIDWSHLPGDERLELQRRLSELHARLGDGQGGWCLDRATLDDMHVLQEIKERIEDKHPTPAAPRSALSDGEPPAPRHIPAQNFGEKI
jgi:hypothetical protein